MFGLNRGQRVARNDDLPIGDYAETLAVFQIQHGLNSIDLTPEQMQRFRLLERTRGDVRAAKHLLYRRWLLRSGRVSR